MKKFSNLNETFKFTQTEQSRANKLYLLVEFAGGDADTEHPEYKEFKNIKFSEYQNHLDEINEVVNEYKILKDILQDTDAKYDDVKSEYGDKIARLFDNAPNDPEADYQFKCYIDSIKLVGYDEQGNKHEAWVR